MEQKTLTGETASGDIVEITAPTANKLVRCGITGRSVWLELGKSLALEVCLVCKNPKGKQPGQCNFTIEFE